MVSNFDKITFILMGISSLIGWNAVLTSMPFFSHQYSYKVFDGFTLPIMMGNFLGAVTVPMWADKVRVKTRIVGFLTILSLLLAFFPILALIAPNETGKLTGPGYNISLGLVFVIGIINSIAQNSMIALAGQEGGVLNMLFWVATGFSGLSMSVLDLFLFSILSSVNNGESYSAIVFFVFAATISILSIFMSIKFLRRKEEQQELENQQQGGMEVTQIENDGSPTSTNRMVKQQQDTEITTGSNASSDLEEQLVSQTDFDSLPMIKKVKIALSHAGFIPLFVWLIYVATFLVFPGLTMLDPQFKTHFLNKGDQVWGQKFLNLTYQIGDVAGKYIGGVDALQKQVPQYIGVIARFGFLFTGLMVAHQNGSFFFNDWFPFVNMLLMATSNGTCTAALMNLGPKTGKGNIKVIGIIGFISAMALTAGIFSGTLFAKLLPKFEPKPWPLVE